MSTIDVNFNGVEYEVTYEGRAEKGKQSVPYGDSSCDFEYIDLSNIDIQEVINIDTDEEIDFSEWDEDERDEFLECLDSCLEDEV